MHETSNTANESWRPLALAIGLSAIALSIIFRLLPGDLRFGMWNLTPIGAMCLYAGARMKLWQAAILPMAAMGLTDLYFLYAKGYDPPLASYGCFALYLLMGATLLRRTESPVRIGLVAFAGSIIFFLVTNFAAWLEQTQPYGYGFDGLMKSYAEGLPFYRGTLIGDLGFSGVFFGAHAWLARTYFPTERVSIPTLETR
jgi:Family of unknown function (DUF6580)